MLNGDVFVFDNVVPMYDLSDDNLKRPDNAADRLPLSGVTEVTVEGVRLSRAALERAARMYAGYSPWVGPPPT